LAESIALFAAPLNSSHHCVVQLIAPVGGVVPHCACEAGAQQTVKRNVSSSNIGFIADKVLQRNLFVNEKSIF
jgi:hypothetical protein